mmetsp:Transcript_158387/g.508046  ORF Transcript_158387/g.508046 Transcript_158387/m.508046 type:complete len:316 (+) Transcript_158387:413-1360(+)
MASINGPFEAADEVIRASCTKWSAESRARCSSSRRRFVTSSSQSAVFAGSFKHSIQNSMSFWTNTCEPPKPCTSPCVKMRSWAGGKQDIRCPIASSAAATRSCECPSLEMASTSLTKSAAGRAASSGVKALAARCKRAIFSSAGSAPLVFAIANNNLTKSLVGHAFSAPAAARATAPTTATRLALFVEATANSSNLGGPRLANWGLAANVHAASVKASEQKLRSPMAKITQASSDTPAASAKVCNRQATSSIAAPALPKVRNTASCSFADGSGCRLSNINKAEVAKVLATSGHVAAPACFTRSRANSMPTSAIMP